MVAYAGYAHVTGTFVIVAVASDLSRYRWMFADSVHTEIAGADGAVIGARSLIG